MLEEGKKIPKNEYLLRVYISVAGSAKGALLFAPGHYGG